MSVSRRDFLKVSASSSAMLMTISIPNQVAAKMGESGHHSDWNVYLTIHPDNRLTIASPVQEMGQHMKTTGPMILAEELDADWSLVTCTPSKTHLIANEEAKGQVKYQFADMNTGGSHAVRRNWAYLREAGASARDMLVRAAAEVWSSPVEEISTSASYLYHKKSGKKLSYGQVAEIAAKLSAPAKPPKLKERDEYRIIGQSATTVDIDQIVTGKPLYGIDMDIPGQLHAVVARCPYYRGDLKSLDDSKARKINGVVDVFKVDAINDGDKKILPAGVAVVAKSLWAAMKAKKELKIEWQNGQWKEESATQMRKDFSAMCENKTPGRLQRDDGDLKAGFAKATQIVESEYFMPYFHHALMEPFSCAADVKGKSATIITGHQFPDKIANDLAKHLALDPLKVDVQSHRMGGGLGRRWESDYVIEAAIISQKMKHPVKVTWMREDEMEQDYFGPMQVTKIKAGIDKSGKIVAWHYRQAKKSGGARAECFPANLIANYQVEVMQQNCGTPTGAWRGPGHLQFAFAIDSMTDELALKANIDPLKYRERLYKNKGTFPYKGFGATEIDSDRMWQCYEQAAKLANWEKKRPKGVGLGIAGHFTFGSYAAFVVEVDARKSPNYRVTHCWGAIDCGLAINPNHIRNQMEGGFIDGLNAAMFNEAQIENGRVITDNFHRLATLRMADAPFDVETAIIENDYPPTGVGEPPTAPAAAALANALFSATGQRLRSLPLKLEA